jgi:hypothetical protein
MNSNSYDLLEHSSFYREFLAERDEILKHKWIESEKAGRDIGYDQALMNWVVHHRAQWRKSRGRGRADFSACRFNGLSSRMLPGELDR